ncbi:hybrid sensor histidine kinase/response regulator transcription factor [Thermophagus sp. OGC60D27]|uniref:hybrid sensor histidine kinase/response regulator transcription factor n=1 Tax=Thermophagus sp. OGC60D27 TaxID=3458415 RepID=UPI0040377063
MTKIKSLVAAFLFLHLCPLYSQDINFSYLGISQGLSQNSVTSLAQDSLGRIWIGTRDGLNLYDGSTISTLRPQKGDSTTLLSHSIKKIISEENRIWVVSKNGISKLNLKNLKFQQFPFDGILTLLPYQDKILVGTQTGLFELDPNKKRFNRVSNMSVGNRAVQTLYTDNSQTLWIGTSDGLYIFTPSSQKTEKLLPINVTSVFTDSRKQTWIGTSNNGIFHLNSHRHLIDHLVHDTISSSIAHNIVRDINEGPDGKIWIGTFLGLSIIDPATNSITNYVHEKNKTNTLSHNSIYSILKDRQGNMWVGTYFGGISYFNPKSNIYKKYPNLSDDGHGFSFNITGEILEDKKGNLWIATEGGGVNFFDKTTQEIKHYYIQDSNTGQKYNNVKTLAFLNQDTLLIGTHLGGLFMLNTHTDHLISLSQTENDDIQTPDIIEDIIPYYNQFLLATKKGLYLFNPVNLRMSYFLDKEGKRVMGDTPINCIFLDSFEKLWIGTEEQGLYSYDDKKGTIKNHHLNAIHNSIIDDNISFVYEDQKFRLWIGTFGSGLYQYLRNKNQFKSYTINSHALPSNFILGIKESSLNNNLWVSSSKGLSRFNIETNHFYNYTHSNGFPLSELNKGALAITNDGHLFVGGLDGLISFKEENLLQQRSQFNLYFTSLFVNNKKVFPNDESKILTKDFAYTNRIQLHHGQNVLTISYSTSNYISTNPSKYRYMLENFDQEWINAGIQNRVTYTNLDPGLYTFRVQGLNGIEDTVVEEKSLLIRVLPPLYKTWYAISFYLLTIILIIWWLNKTYRSKIRLKEKIKTEQHKKEQIQKINQEKLEFFTNISHEFKTPLTLITGNLETVLENPKIKPDLYNKLLIIHKNAARLNNLITELLAFRKLEQGFSQLNIEEHNLHTFLYEIFQSFSEYAQHMEIDYQFNCPSGPLIWFDKNKMEKVIFNLISNAFKFVEKKTGSISLKVEEYENSVNILISDNGRGMSTAETTKVFDRFYQIDNSKGKNSELGSGIGLALSQEIIKKHEGNIFVTSQEGKGTCFTVNLKKGKEHFKNAKLVSKKAPPNHSKPLTHYFLDPKTPSDSEKPKMVAAPDASKILIVDDEPDVRTFLTELLQSTYNIVEASNGKEGIQKAITTQPDLIISDIMMPVISGTEMCAKLKRNIQTSHIPIVLLTAKTAVEYKIEGIETGADDYITKPFNVKLFKTRIKNIIQNRALIQQKFTTGSSFEVREITTNSMDQKLLQKAIKIIEKNIENNEFKVEEFAKEMGLGRTNLFIKIKGLTGQTPNDFIKTIRLKKAAQMILNKPSGSSISDIAYSVGFSSPRYFSRCFREHFGVTPSNFSNREH